MVLVLVLLLVSYNNPDSQKLIIQFTKYFFFGIATSEPVFNVVWVILSFTFFMMIFE